MPQQGPQVRTESSASLTLSVTGVPGTQFTQFSAALHLHCLLTLLYSHLTPLISLSRLLLLLSCLSHIRLCVTPQTAAHQAPPSLGFSRQEHWSGLPLPSPMQEGVPDLPVAPQDEAGLTKTFQTWPRGWFHIP